MRHAILCSLLQLFSMDPIWSLPFIQSHTVLLNVNLFYKHRCSPVTGFFTFEVAGVAAVVCQLSPGTAGGAR